MRFLCKILFIQSTRRAYLLSNYVNAKTSKARAGSNYPNDAKICSSRYVEKNAKTYKLHSLKVYLDFT